MTINVTWDSSPVRTQFGAMDIVCDGVAEVAGKRYRVNASATRGARKPDLILRYLSDAKRGHAVPESHLADVRAAALASFAELLKPVRAAIVAEANKLESEMSAETAALFDFPTEEVTEAPVTLATDYRTAEVTSPRFAFLVADMADGVYLCEGGVYSDQPKGEYSHHTLEAAESDAADYSRRYKATYRVVTSAVAVKLDSTVLGSLEDWQVTAILDCSAKLVANTTRACYWRIPGGYVALAPNLRPTGNGGAYKRLDSIMRLKGESESTVRQCCTDDGAARD
jgi:hypothetical protein